MFKALIIASIALSFGLSVASSLKTDLASQHQARHAAILQISE